MDKVLLPKEEIDSLLKIQNDQALLANQLGSLEYQIQSLNLDKESLIKQLKDLQDRSQELGKILQEKYGEGTINIESGEFIKA